MSCVFVAPHHILIYPTGGRKKRMFELCMFQFPVFVILADKVLTLQFQQASVTAVILAIHRQLSCSNHKQTKATTPCQTYIFQQLELLGGAACFRPTLPSPLPHPPNSASLRRQSDRVHVPALLSVPLTATRLISDMSHLQHPNHTRRFVLVAESKWTSTNTTCAHSLHLPQISYHDVPGRRTSTKH
jgi:hypothetical protein